MRSRKFVMVLSYTAFAVAALLVGLYLTFPAEAVGQRIAHEINKRSLGKFVVSFDDVSPYRLSGIAASGVKVRVEQPGAQPLEIKLDAVRVRLRLLPLLLLRASFNAVIKLGAGDIDAVVTPRRDGELDAAVDLEKVNLASPPLLPLFVGVPIGGVINGHLETSWKTDSKKSTGKAHLALGGGTVGPGGIQGISIPGVDLGQVELELALDDGRLRVASFKQDGGALQAKVSGSSLVRADIGASTLDACIEFKADPAFLDKNPKMKTVLQLAEVQLRKSPQGFLNVPLAGTLSQPRLKNGLCRSPGRD
jgi:type II secretion system protein N